MRGIEKPKNFTVNDFNGMGIARATIYGIIRRTEKAKPSKNIKTSKKTLKKNRKQKLKDEAVRKIG